MENVEYYRETQIHLPMKAWVCPLDLPILRLLRVLNDVVDYLQQRLQTISRNVGGLPPHRRDRLFNRGGGHRGWRLNREVRCCRRSC